MTVADHGYAGSVVAFTGRFARPRRGLVRFVEGGSAIPSVAAAAVAVHVLVSLAQPLAAGRDLPRYLLAYAQLGDGDVLYPHALLTRTPVAALVSGGLLDAGQLAAEAGAVVLYAPSVVAWFAVARRFGPAAAVATAIALLAYPGYVLLFHRLSSDSIFAAGFALVALFAVRAYERPTAGRTAALGAGIALCVLIRPAASVLLVLALVPLLAAPGWRERIRSTAALVLAAAIPLLGWAVHNGLRLDDYTVVRGGGTALPLFRAFVTDRIVEPGNGPASEELARVVARELLPREPYRSFGIDLDEFFSSGSTRMHDDLVVLSDRTWGWDDDYGHLARVGREAVLAHPWAYTEGVTRDLWRLLFWPLYGSADTTDAAAPRGEGTARGSGVLPVPSEGEPIPSSRTAPYLSTPDGRIRQVWTSPTRHFIAFPTAAETRRATELDRRVVGLLASLPDREARPEATRWLNSASRWYPRPIVWLLVGLVAVALRRPRGAAVPLALAGSALLVLLVTALAVFALAEYSVSVVPAFVLLATVGVLGRNGPARA